MLVAKGGETRDVRFRGSQGELEFVLPFGVFLVFELVLPFVLQSLITVLLLV